MPSCSRRDILITTLLLTLTRSRMELAGGAGGGGGGERQVPGQQQGEILIMQTSKAKSPHASTGGLAVADTHHDTQLTFVGILCRVCCAR